MEKIISHIVRVTENSEKIQFQLKLPENTRAISEIYVSAFPQSVHATGNAMQDYQPDIGWLWLRAVGKPDVFFSHVVKRSLPLYDVGIIGVESFGPFSEGSFWIHGVKQEFISLPTPVISKVIEGFYIDRFSLDNPEYNLTIYLKIFCND